MRSDDAKNGIKILIGVVINANILAAIATFIWLVLTERADIWFPGYFTVNAISLVILVHTFHPRSIRLVDQMWERFYFSSGIFFYLIVLWLFDLI